MVKRNFDRIAVGYKAELLFGDKQFECVIENLSSTGACILTASTNSDGEFQTYEILELRFEPKPGEIINLHCKIIWSKQIQPHRLTKKIGLKIINPSWEQSTSFL